MAKDDTAPLEECPYANCEATSFESVGWDEEVNEVQCSEGHTIHVDHGDDGDES